MKRIRKRLLSLLLCICMVAGLLPVTAGAAGDGTQGNPFQAGFLLYVNNELVTGSPIWQNNEYDEFKLALNGVPAPRTDGTEGIYSITLYLKDSSGGSNLLQINTANAYSYDETAAAYQFTWSNGLRDPDNPSTQLMPDGTYDVWAIANVLGADGKFLREDYYNAGQVTVREGTSTRTIDMTVTRDGAAVTEFANTDTITITANMPSGLTNAPEVNSVFFGNTWIYIETGDVVISGTQVTITLHGLYKAEYDSETQTEVKGALLSPGSGTITFYDDGNGGIPYVSNATYTVTPGGVEPGGEQGISGADAFFTTQRDNNNTERILSRQPYSLYLYTNQPLTGTETATATIHYNDGSAKIKVVNLSGEKGGYVLSGGDTLDNDVTGTVNKVTFQLGDDITDVTIGKEVISTVQVTFEGAAGAGVVKYLKVYDGDKLLETVSLGRDVPESTYVTVSTNNATFKVTGTQNGREVEYATGTASGNAVSLTLKDVTLTQVTPSVQTDSNSTLASYQYTLKWYASENEDAEPIATGSSYYLFSDETVYVQASPAGSLLTKYQTSARERVTANGAAPTITLQSYPSQTVSGTVKLNNTTPLSGVTITVTNTVDGSSASNSATTGTDGGFTLSTPVLEGAVLTASRGDLEAKTQTLQANTNNDNIQITLSARKGMITLPQQNLFASCTLTMQGGAPVAFTTSGDKQYIYLTDPTAAAGQTLKMRLNTTSMQKYADLTVTLDEDGCAAIPSSEIQWISRGCVCFTLSNPGRQLCYALLYDGNGTLLDVDKRSGVASSAAKITYNSNYLDIGNYTYLFMGKGTWQAISDVQDSLAETKAALSSDLYLEKSFTIHAGDRLTFAGTLPMYAKENDLNLETSGLSVTAESDLISVRMTVAPKDATNSDSLYVYLYTNQTSTNTAGNLPNIINGSLYINGKHPDAGDVWIDPNDIPNDTVFTGLYQIQLDGVVEKYGGWPVTLQWQSYRTNLDRVEALAQASLDKGDTYHYVGETTLYEPAITLYAPEAVADSSFYVYGNAPANSTVTLFVDGVETAQLNANDSGLYNAQLSLDNPIGPGYHTVFAKAVTSDNKATATSNVMDVRYNASLPVLTKIELTNYKKDYVTVWDSKPWAAACTTT